MSLSEARYHDLVDAVQESVEDVFDDTSLDVDLENSGGVLTVRFDNGSQLILSRQPAAFISTMTKAASCGCAMQAASASESCSRG